MKILGPRRAPELAFNTIAAMLFLFAVALATPAMTAGASTTTAHALAAVTAVDSAPEPVTGLSSKRSKVLPKRQLSMDGLMGDKIFPDEAVAMLSVPSSSILNDVSTATPTDVSSDLSAGPVLNVGHSNDSTATSAFPTLVGRDKQMSSLNWPTIQNLRHRVYFDIADATVNRFLDSNLPFKKMCVRREDCSLAVGSIPIEEAVQALRLDVVGLSPDKECDELCVMENLDQACSTIARNSLTRIALIRNDMKEVGVELLDDEATYQRISIFHQMATVLPAFRRENRQKFIESLANYKKTAQTPIIGRVAVPDNSTFLDTLLHNNVCSGDEFLCNHDPMLRLHMAGMLHAAIDSDVLLGWSVLLDTLLAARRGALSQPGQIWPERGFSDDRWWKVNIHRDAITEVVAGIDKQRPTMEAMSPTKFYWTESFNISDGRHLTPTLILDRDRTRALHPALKKQGYGFFQSYFGGHAFVRQSGLLKSTSDDKWQALRLGVTTNGPESNATNTTATSPTTGPATNRADQPSALNPQANRIRHTMPINEAESLRDSLRGRDMPAYYPTDKRTRGARDVQYQIRSGGEHMDSLGRPIMRAYMLAGQHRPVMMSGDSLPWHAASSFEMRFSQPVLKPGVDASNPGMPELPFNTSEPAASYVRVTGPIAIDEVIVCAAHVQQQQFWRAPHSLDFGTALVVADGSKLSRELSEKANSGSAAASLPGESATYAEAESAWEVHAAPASTQVEGYRAQMNISRIQAIVAAYDAGYNLTRREKPEPPKQKAESKRNSQQLTGPGQGGEGGGLTERTIDPMLPYLDIGPPALGPPNVIHPDAFLNKPEYWGELPPGDPYTPLKGMGEDISDIPPSLGPGEAGLETTELAVEELAGETYDDFLLTIDVEAFQAGAYDPLVGLLFGPGAAQDIAITATVESIGDIVLADTPLLGFEIVGTVAAEEMIGGTLAATLLGISDATAAVLADPLTWFLVPAVLGIGGIITGIVAAVEKDDHKKPEDQPGYYCYSNCVTSPKPKTRTPPGHSVLTTEYTPPPHTIVPPSAVFEALEDKMNGTATTISRHLQGRVPTTFQTSTVSGLTPSPDTSFITVDDIRYDMTIHTDMSLMTAQPPPPTPLAPATAGYYTSPTAYFTSATGGYDTGPKAYFTSAPVATHHPGTMTERMEHCREGRNKIVCPSAQASIDAKSGASR